MLTFKLYPYFLDFIRPAGTSRGVMMQKKSWLLQLNDLENNKTAWGECSIIEGLSPEYTDNASYLSDAHRVFELCALAKGNNPSWSSFPSLHFAWETAMQSLQTADPFCIFDTPFYRGKQGIPINGLIWMGDIDFMRKQIDQKLKAGFRCLKLKIGAQQWEDELLLLTELRSHFPLGELEIRVDANGAYSFEQACYVLEALGKLGIHSIEQPIKAGQWKQMEALCRMDAVPIALDEELIPAYLFQNKLDLIQAIRPQYIVLKPSLHGGFSGCNEWIQLAQNNSVNWWITSALESNIGLNAIAQYASQFPLQFPQGLGTGALYQNNAHSPLHVKKDSLWYEPSIRWEIACVN